MKIMCRADGIVKSLMQYKFDSLNYNPEVYYLIFLRHYKEKIKETPEGYKKDKFIDINNYIVDNKSQIIYYMKKWLSYRK